MRLRMLVIRIHMVSLLFVGKICRPYLLDIQNYNSDNLFALVLQAKWPVSLMTLIFAKLSFLFVILVFHVNYGGDGNKNVGKGLINRNMSRYLSFKTLYLSLPSSAKTTTVKSSVFWTS